MKNKMTVQFTKYQLFIVVFLMNCFCFTAAFAQKKQDFNLSHLLKENKLVLNNKSPKPLDDTKRNAISAQGIIWLKDVDFSEGTIEVDLRGKDLFQKSFLGIAFHGIDTTTYDAIYFRPFNFRAKDSIRRIHAVQYMSLPDKDWYILREQFPGKYENGVTPAPQAEEWFHARIVIKGKDITVFVNNSKEPSLSVQKLNERKEGMIGLWGVGSDGDFANLTIRRD
jgi:hypothetical protein